MKTKIITICFFLILQFLFVSENCRSQWIKTNGPAGGSGPYSFAVIGSTIFAGTTSGLYRSNDNGLTWTITTLSSGTVRGLAHSGSSIYAGTSTGMRISTDNGTTWSATSLTSNIYAVAADGQYVFAGTSGNGLWRSTDYGLNWVRITEVPQSTFYCLAINGSLVYAGSSYVYRSINNGDNWVRVGTLSEPIHALAIKGSRVFATSESSFWNINYGIYGSNDSGVTWPIRALTNRDIWSFAVCGDYIFAGDQEDPTGVYRSSDDGITWVQTALNNVNIYAISFTGSTIFAGTSNELFISTDNGETWPVNTGILNNSYVYSLAASETNIFAGTNKFVFRTSDNGESWNCGLDKYVRAIITKNSDIFAGDYGVYRSSDNGSTWTLTALNNRTVYSLAVSGNNIFAGTSSYGVYSSSDDGQTWTQTTLNNRYVYSLAVSGNNIFAGTISFGVYRSTDDGQTWTQTALNNKTIYALAASGSNIFAGTSSYGVYLSADDGQTWTQTALNNRTVYALAASGSNVFAGDYGVYFSPDNGLTWQTAGMDATTINSFLIKDNNIYAGTSGKAVWKRLMSDLISPHLISPINDSVVNTFLPALDWEGMNGVSYYSLKVSKDVNFASTVVDVTNMTEHSYTVPSGILEDSTSYFWKVSAMGGAWSEVWKFTVIIPITPQYTTDKIEILKGDILDLLNSNIISQDNYEMLVSKLNNAIQQIEQQHYKISINMVEQFIFEIDLLSRKLILTPEQTQPLLTQAYIIVYMLNILDGSDNDLLKITDQQVKTYKLNQNYPNPFNPSTTIKFSIAKNGVVNLSVYDVCGRLVKNIVNSRLNAGSYEYLFNGANLASGIYFYKLVTQNFTDIKKMVLVK